MPIVLENGLCYSDLLDFEEIPGAVPSIDDYGLDELTRTYEGRNSLLDQFLATWFSPLGVPLNTPDVTYAEMFAVSRAPSIDRAFTKVAVKFVGKINGKEPLPKIEDTWKENTTQATATTGAGGTPANQLFPVMLDYQAGGVSYEYCSRTRPSSPRYPDGATLNSVVISTVTAGADTIINTATPHGLTAGEYIVLSGISGTTPDLNDINIVKSVTDADTFTIETSSSVGGSGGTVTPLELVYTPTRVRGQFQDGDTYSPATGIYLTFDQNLSNFTRKQNGLWWECKEAWEWIVSSALTTSAP